MSITYTVTQINNNVDNILQTKFDDIFIEGEISSLNISPSGHAYYTLKDDKRELSCVIFNRYLQKYKDIMIVGNTVIVKGSLSLYKPKGHFQFKSFSISPLGKGKFWKEFEKIFKMMRYITNIRLHENTEHLVASPKEEYNLIMQTIYLH